MIPPAASREPVAGKRLAASFEIAARDNEFAHKRRKRIVLLAVRTDRRTMRDPARIDVRCSMFSG
jgi:Uncharacterized protein conserved in bacteria (DUF2252)